MARVPNTVDKNFVVVTGQITMGIEATAIVTTTVDCVETAAAAKTSTTSVSGPVTNQTQTLFSGFIDGADVNNNTIRVKISRSPGDGSDTAVSASVLIRSIQVSMSQKSVNGRVKDGEMTFKS